MASRAGDRSILLFGLSVILVCSCGCHALHDSSLVTVDDSFDTPRAEKLHRRAVKLMNQGDLRSAEGLLQNAIIADQTFGPAHNNLGWIQLQNRDLYSAAWSFQRARELMPERGEPLNNLGLVMEEGDRFQEAITAYAEANELDPKNPEFLGNLIRARIRAGDRDESLTVQLSHLIFLDSRPEWIRWARENLARELAAPASDGIPDLNGPDRTRGESRSGEALEPIEPSRSLPQLNRPQTPPQTPNQLPGPGPTSQPRIPAPPQQLPRELPPPSLGPAPMLEEQIEG